MRRLLLLSALLGALAVHAGARAGGGQSYTSSTSSSRSSSYSGGSYSRSYSSYDSGGYYSGRRGGPGLLDLYVAQVVRYPLVGIPLTLLLLWLLIRCANSVQASPPSAFAPSPVATQAQDKMDWALERLAVRDPAFDRGAFRERCRAAFLSIQSAWSAGDMAPARAFISDGVSERFGRQLAALKARGLRNVLSDIRIHSIELVHAESDAHFDALSLLLRVSADDATLNEAGRRVVSLSPGRQEFQEVWTFLRRPGARTLKRPGTLEGACPSCGAPVSIVDAARCETCRTWVNSGDHDWVLSEITQACEWTPPEPIERVAGWAEASNADPALSVPALEDRVSVLFWRRLPPAIEDAAVGSVDLGRLEKDSVWRRAHLRVRWSGAGEVRTDVFILRRALAAVTDPRQGLRTARCPSCGAPPSGNAEAACAYCGAPPDDGKRDWAVERVVPLRDWKPTVSAGMAAGHVVAPSSAGTAPPAPPPWSGSLSAAAGFAVLAQAMLADGEETLAERSFLDSYAASRGLPPHLAAKILASARDNTLDAPQAASGEEAEALLRGMIRMSAADGVVTLKERGALDAFAARFGLRREDVTAMIREERAPRAA